MRPSTVTRKGALSVAFESLFSTPFGVEVVKAYDILYTSKAVALSAPAQDSLRADRARQILLGVGAGGLVLGGVMTVLALSARDDARAASQVEIPSMNRKIDRYNTVAIVGYGIAAASGASWLALKLWSRKPGRPSTTVLPILSPAELAVGLAGAWGD
jgi:hypothetical protein